MCRTLILVAALSFPDPLPFSSPALEDAFALPFPALPELAVLVFLGAIIQRDPGSVRYKSAKE